jgi:hypothetical protein
LVSALDATVLCACISPVATPTDRPPADPASVAALFATTALPSSTPRPYACDTDAALPTTVAALDAVLASESPLIAPDQPSDSAWPSSALADDVAIERVMSAAPENAELSDNALPSIVVPELDACAWLYPPPTLCVAEMPAACPVVVVASAPPDAWFCTATAELAMLKASAEPSVDLAFAELAASELEPAWVTPTLPAIASYSAVRASTYCVAAATTTQKRTQTILLAGLDGVLARGGGRLQL